MSSSSWTPTELFGECFLMIPVVDPFTKFSLKKEQTPQLAILDTFRSGVTAALQRVVLEMKPTVEGFPTAPRPSRPPPGQLPKPRRAGVRDRGT